MLYELYGHSSGILYDSIFISMKIYEVMIWWTTYMDMKGDVERSQAMYQEKIDSKIWLHKDIDYQKFIYT